MSEQLTARAAANRLGISVRTFDRHLAGWIAEGLVTVQRTPGGHRRFDAAEIAALRPPEPTPMPPL